MGPHRQIYFAVLAGSACGLLAWGVSGLAGVALAGHAQGWTADSVVLIAFGFFTGALLPVFMDRIAESVFRWRSVGSGVLLGISFALLASLLVSLLRWRVAPESPVVFRLSVWAFSMSLIALGLGVRWARTNRPRVLHTYAGGVAGGLLGGLIFTGLGPHAPELSQAFGLMLTGAGTGFGAALSPLMLSEGTLQFISSGDARAQSKYGRTHREWALEQDESYVLGSAATSQTDTRFQPGADIFIPDALLSPRHAVIYARDGRFYVARHPDAGGPAGLARYVLRVRGKTVTTSQPLNPSDDLLVGKTALRFTSKGNKTR